ncbi:MAG: type II toxin-antitoxin system death-on-curing family toxin [Candidatus Competibacteraceae bacterium]|nr:type II toxin-antitoxin system death-on-curing family toxin [Candidatus Competibacteraceae bacterium]
MREPRWLLESVVLAIHTMLLEAHGGEGGLRDQDLLASALARPRNKYAYEDDCSLFDLAAAYSFGLAKNHPFIDGNKRTAFLCGTLFLELNGLKFTATEPDAALTFEGLAAGTVSEADLAAWFELNSGRG